MLSAEEARQKSNATLNIEVGISNIDRAIHRATLGGFYETFCTLSVSDTLAESIADYLRNGGFTVTFTRDQRLMPRFPIELLETVTFKISWFAQ